MGEIVSLKNKRNAATDQIYHPLMNVAPPSVEDLKARCFNDESAALLKAACRLASYRVHCLGKVKVAYDEYTAKPAGVIDLEIDENEEVSLTEIDLVRAFLGCQTQYLVQNFFLDESEGVRSIFPVSEEFKKSAAHWKNILQSYQAENLPQNITLRWSRRWAMLLLEKPELKIDINMWISSVFDIIPPGWSKLYSEGLITTSETRTKIRRIYIDKLAPSHDVDLQNFPKVPHAFYDRHGLVFEANTLLENGCGIFIVGEDDTVRRDLVKVLTANINYSQNLSALEIIKGGGGDYLTATLQQRVVKGKQTKPKIYAYLGNIPEGVGGPAWNFDVDDDIFGPMAEVAIDFFVQIAALNKEDHVRFVIAMKPAEIQTLAELVTAIKNIPVIEIPKVDEKDLIPYFLCHLPSILEWSNCTPPLGLFLDFLFQTSRTKPAFLSSVNAGAVNSYVNREKEDLGLLISSPFGMDKERPFAWLSRKHTALPRRVIQKILHESKPFFEKYIGGLERFEKLVAMYEILTKLNDTQLPELNLMRYGTEKELIDTYVSKEDMRTDPVTGKPYKVDPATGQEVQPNKKFQENESYVKVVSELPRPTSVQTAQFAAYVADAHSWYKHLPLYPKTPVYLFIDPNAGMKLERDKNGNVRYVEEKDPKGVHYTHMTTEEYRKRFGHWNYHMDQGGKLLDPMKLMKEGLTGASLADLDTKIQGVRSESHIIPPRLLNKGKALVSAFVHEQSPVHIWMDCKPWLLKQKHDEFLLYLPEAPKELSANLQFVWAVLKTDGWYPLQDKNPLKENECYQDFFSKEAIPYRCWKDQAFLMAKADGTGGIEHYPKTLLAAEILRTQESREGAVLEEQKYHSRKQYNSRLVNKKDREILLKKWRDELSSASIDKALMILLNDWNNLESTKILLEKEFSESDHDDKKVIEKLVKENLASGIEHITSDKNQKKEAHKLWHNLVYKDEDFSSFAEKHNPPSPVVKDLIEHLVRERIQQLESMVSAMNCFIDNVYRE